MNNQSGSFTFYGGSGSVTGSNFGFSYNGHNVMIDCGLYQGDRDAFMKNHEPFVYDPSSFHTLIPTHAHIDHIGRIPKLVEDGFHGSIYSTPSTKALAQLMFDDAYGIMEYHHKKGGPEPLYRESSIEKTMKLWTALPYHEPMKLSDDITATLYDAGHILGSAMIALDVNGRRLVYTGDIGNSPSILLRDTEVIPDVHTLITETVYGDRNHEHRDDRKQMLHQAIKDIASSSGTLMIPVFSLERTQEILYVIKEAYQQGLVPRIPVFLDSPLAISVNHVYREYATAFKASVKRELEESGSLLSFPELTLSHTRDDSIEINSKPAPKIVLAGSGMSHGGRIIHHEMRYLPDHKSILLLVGYQAEGTLGRKLHDGADSIQIYHHDIPVRADVRMISGFSAHKDRDDMLDWATQLQSSSDTFEQVYAVLGERNSSNHFAQKVRDYLGVKAIVPHPNETYLF